MSGEGGRRTGEFSLTTVTVLAFVAAGAALRLGFPTDIEFKADEHFFFVQARQLAAGAPWLWVGPPSSVGSPEPALTDWVFGALASIFHPATPPDLARCVQGLAIAALAIFTGFAISLPPDRRPPWLWAAALWAVNPVAIILERKIWNPSLLPLPAVLFLIAWHFRRHRAAAFAWGALGSVLAQIHPGAAFMAFALALWTWLAQPRAFRWASWLAGAIVGALPAIPWMMAMLHPAGGAHLTHLRFPIASYYLRFLTQPFGFGADYALGKAFLDFLGWPRLGGTQTWLVLGLHIGLGVIALIGFTRAAMRLAHQRRGPPWRAIFLGEDDDGVLISAALWGYGGLLTLITIGPADSHRHYLELVAPVMALWCARLFLGAGPRGGRVLLPTLCAAQLAVSACLLAYIDQRQVIPGDYGTIWRAQAGNSATLGPPSPATSRDRPGDAH